MEIDLERLGLPNDVPGDQWLIIEGAGGGWCRSRARSLQTNFFSRWQAPIVLCARTALGTINHSLLSIEALRRRNLKLLGIVFVGDENKDTERTIVEFSGVKRLGRLPMLKNVNRETLMAAFAAGFDRQDFEAAHGG